MAILQLTLKKKWFDMTLSGEKTEEYREIKPYWLQRFLDTSQYPAEDKDDYKNLVPNILFDYKEGHSLLETMHEYYCGLKTFDETHFVNGYGAHRPAFDIECMGIRIGIGKPEWGAPTHEVFIISHGKIIKP